MEKGKGKGRGRDKEDGEEGNWEGGVAYTSLRGYTTIFCLENSKHSQLLKQNIIITKCYKAFSINYLISFQRKPKSGGVNLTTPNDATTRDAVFA